MSWELGAKKANLASFFNKEGSGFLKDQVVFNRIQKWLDGVQFKSIPVINSSDGFHCIKLLLNTKKFEVKCFKIYIRFQQYLMRLSEKLVRLWHTLNNGSSQQQINCSKKAYLSKMLQVNFNKFCHPPSLGFWEHRISSPKLSSKRQFHKDNSQFKLRYGLLF